jgi:putative phosphoribosyl transferase
MAFRFLKDKFRLQFKNRVFAANILAGALEKTLRRMKIDKEKETLLVLGIPRGGVVVADVLASKLSYKCEFDIIIPRKLTTPGNQEIAIGAIMEDGTNYTNQELINELEVGQDYLEKEKARQMDEIKRRRSLYRNAENRGYGIQDKIAILVDDGAATGATLMAAARWIRKKNPRKLIVAVPVAPQGTVEAIKRECDLVVAGTTVPSATAFESVAQYYQEFKPVEDHTVIEICKKRNIVK